MIVETKSYVDFQTLYNSASSFGSPTFYWEITDPQPEFQAWVFASLGQPVVIALNILAAKPASFDTDHPQAIILLDPLTFS